MGEINLLIQNVGDWIELISRHHNNRRSYNWLAYNRSDYFLQKYSSHFKGVLYDLGAGEAPYKEFFLQYADSYIAVDWPGSYHNTEADLVADLNKKLPIGDALADTVVSLSVLEHLREPQLMLKEAFRILKPGRMLVVEVPWQWWIHEAPFDFFRYTPFGLQHLMKEAGFIDIRVEPQGGFFTMLALKINYFSLRFIRGPRAVRWVLTRCLSMIWYVSQKSAPILDKLDRDWDLESIGYFVTAKKAARGQKSEFA